MSDRYLKVLPFLVLSKEPSLTLTSLRVFTIMCDMADEDGYVIDPENYIIELGFPLRLPQIKTGLNKLVKNEWITLVERIRRHNIWKILVEPHHSANVKKFIVTDGSIEVTITSVGKDNWINELNEKNNTTINNVVWNTEKK